MKLFKIVQKSVEGQCDASRCKEKPVGQAKYGNLTVNLCERHLQELERHNSSNGQTPVAPAVTTSPQASDLSGILVSNLAVKAGAVESRQAAAEQIRRIAGNLKVSDVRTRDQADGLLDLVHKEEKALKKEIDAMYKPVKDAAKNTKNTLDSWFGETLRFYAETKKELKEKLGNFLQLQKAKEDVALASGDHDAAISCVTEPSKHVSLRRKYTYAIENGGANLPLEFMTVNENLMQEIVKIVPREYLIPNYDLINKMVQEHGHLFEVPDVTVILEEKVQMKAGCSK